MSVSRRHSCLSKSARGKESVRNNNKGLEDDMQAASARAQQAEIDRPKSAPVVVAIRLQLGSLRGRHAFER